MFVWHYCLFVLLNGKILYYYNEEFFIFIFLSNIAILKKRQLRYTKMRFHAFVINNLCSGNTIIINNNNTIVYKIIKYFIIPNTINCYSIRNAMNRFNYCWRTTRVDTRDWFEGVFYNNIAINNRLWKNTNPKEIIVVLHKR